MKEILWKTRGRQSSSPLGLNRIWLRLTMVAECAERERMMDKEQVAGERVDVGWATPSVAEIGKASCKRVLGAFGREL